VYPGKQLVGFALLATALSIGPATPTHADDSAKASAITLVRALHRWDLDDEEVRLHIKVVLRNDGPTLAEGTVSIKVLLQNDGLEEDYLQQTMMAYGPKLADSLRGGQHPRSKAILSYIERGKVLPEGKTYEPVEAIEEPKFVRLKIPVRLAPGEMQRFVREDWVPDDHGGFRVKLEVEGLEVKA
jgi:hypothetical protein